MERKLEKWWMEWDPVNKWLQVGGHVKRKNGHYDQVWVIILTLEYFIFFHYCLVPKVITAMKSG